MKPCAISVIGMGYVGLSVAIGFSSKNYHVVASDIDVEKLQMIIQGKLPFHEPDMEDYLKHSVSEGSLECAKNSKDAILATDVTFVTVGTPSQVDGAINLEYMQMAASEIGSSLKQKSAYHLVVIKSTVTPNTTEKMLKTSIEKNSNKKCGLDFGLCMNPEFLREGSALHDMLYPDRIIIGEHDKKSGDTLENLFKAFYGKNMPPIMRTNLATAELIKYANNAFLATKISYINTIANICEKIPGADVTDVAKAMGLDQRISSSFLRAGLGYGGSCFPKDLNALIDFSIKHNYLPLILQSVEKVNNNQAKHVIKLITDALGELSGKRVALLGLSFKPNTDDMRTACSIPIIRHLLNNEAIVTVYDPVAMPNAEKIFRNSINYAISSIECIKNADCCVIVTEWNEFTKLKLDSIKNGMRTPVIVDGRRVIDPDEALNHNIVYYGIGYGTIKKVQKTSNL